MQAETIARGLFAVALVDGVHERELALISELYRTAAAHGSSAEVVAPLASLSPLEPSGVAAVLVTPPERALFVKTAILLAWADGKVSEAERANRRVRRSAGGNGR